MYTHIIQVYRRAPVDAEPSARACTFISTRTRMHEGMGCRQPQMEPRMHVCAPRHPYTPRGTSAQASRHKLAWNLHVHTYAHACKHTHTRTHGDTHLAVARSDCAAARAARAHTHAHSCTSARAHPRWNARYGRTQTSIHARMHMLMHVYLPTAPYI
jgi:hypothetical protein